MASDAEVPSEIIARLRSICGGLPETREEPAWVGTRWRIRGHTFAHVLTIEAGWPPAYARAAGTDEADGPITVMTFQSSGPELDAFSHIGHPFFRPRWRPGIVGMVLGAEVDWDEISELLVESYCLLAPAKLVQKVERPAG